MEAMAQRMRRFADILVRSKTLSIFIILLLLFIFFALFSPNYMFATRNNLINILAMGSEFTIVVLGVGLLMIAGEFDLSVGSILVFSSYIFVLLFQQGWSPFIAGVVVLFLGALLGLFNGFITVKLKIPSFVTTLGAMMIWRGVTLLFSGGFAIPIHLSGTFFSNLLSHRVFNLIPMQVLWFILFAFILGAILHYHQYGNWIFATGDRKESARAMGIPVDRVKMACFSILGLLCAFAAILQTVRLGAFSSRAGDGWELRAIAASVVGGTLLWGGSGSMAGIFWGAFIITVLENGLVVMRIPNDYTYIFYGIIIVSSVVLHSFLEKKRLDLGSAETGAKKGLVKEEGAS